MPKRFVGKIGDNIAGKMCIGTYVYPNSSIQVFVNNVLVKNNDMVFHYSEKVKKLGEKPIYVKVLKTDFSTGEITTIRDTFYYQTN